MPEPVAELTNIITGDWSQLNKALDSSLSAMVRWAEQAENFGTRVASSIANNAYRAASNVNVLSSALVSGGNGFRELGAGARAGMSDVKSATAELSGVASEIRSTGGATMEMGRQFSRGMGLAADSAIKQGNRITAMFAKIRASMTAGFGGDATGGRGGGGRGSSGGGGGGLPGSGGYGRFAGLMMLSAGAMYPIKAALGSYVDFDAQLHKIYATAGEVVIPMNKMRDSILAIASQVGKSPVELVKALFNIESAGFHGADALNMLRQTATTAAAGMADTNDVATTLTKALTAYGHSAKDAGEFSDVLIRGITAAHTDLATAAQPIANLLDVAVNARVSFQDLMTAFATVTRTAKNPAASATYLVNTLNRLINPTTAMKKAAHELGLEWLAMGQGAEHIQKVGLPAVLQEIARETNRNPAIIDVQFPDLRTNRAILSLLRSGRGFTDIQKMMGKAGGSTDSALAVQNQALARQLETLRAKLEAFWIHVAGIGAKLLNPVLKTIIPFVDKIVDWFDKLSPSAQKVLVIIGLAVGAFVALAGPIGILAMYILPALGAGLELIGGAFEALAGPIGIVVAAVALLITAWTRDWGHIREVTAALVEWLKPYLQQFGAWVASTWHEITTSVTSFWEKIRPEVMQILGWLSAFTHNMLSQSLGFWETWGQAIWGSVRAHFEVIKGVILLALNAIETMIEVFFNFITGHWAKMWTDLQDGGRRQGSILSTVMQNAMKDVRDGFEKTVDSMSAYWQTFLAQIANGATLQQAMDAANTAAAGAHGGQIPGVPPGAPAGMASGVAKWQPLINAAAKQTGVDPKLIAAIMTAESGGNPKSLSNKGATGLMQIMPSNFKALGMTKPWDPAQNITGGAEMLRGLILKYGGNIRDVAAGYNAGEGAVDKYGGVPPYKQTQAYVAKVQSLYGADTTSLSGGSPYTLPPIIPTNVGATSGAQPNKILGGMYGAGDMGALIASVDAGTARLKAAEAAMAALGKIAAGTGKDVMKLPTSVSTYASQMDTLAGRAADAIATINAQASAGGDIVEEKILQLQRNAVQIKTIADQIKVVNDAITSGQKAFTANDKAALAEHTRYKDISKEILALQLHMNSERAKGGKPSADELAHMKELILERTAAFKKFENYTNTAIANQHLAFEAEKTLISLKKDKNALDKQDLDLSKQIADEAARAARAIQSSLDSQMRALTAKDEFDTRRDEALQRYQDNVAGISAKNLPAALSDPLNAEALQVYEATLAKIGDDQHKAFQSAAFKANLDLIDQMRQSIQGLATDYEAGTLSLKDYLDQLRGWQAIASQNYVRDMAAGDVEAANAAATQFGDLGKTIVTTIKGANAKALKDAKDTAEKIANAFTDSFMQVVKKSKSWSQLFKETFRDLAERGLTNLMKTSVQKIALHLFPPKKIAQTTPAQLPEVVFSTATNIFGNAVTNFTAAVNAFLTGKPSAGASASTGTVGGLAGAVAAAQKGVSLPGTAGGGTLGALSAGLGATTAALSTYAALKTAAAKGTVSNIGAAVNSASVLASNFAKPTQNAAMQTAAVVGQAASTLNSIATVSKFAQLSSAMSTAMPYIGLVTAAISLFSMASQHKSSPAVLQQAKIAPIFKEFSSFKDTGYSGQEGLRSLLGSESAARAGIHPIGASAPNQTIVHVTIAPGAVVAHGVNDPKQFASDLRDEMARQVLYETLSRPTGKTG